MDYREPHKPSYFVPEPQYKEESLPRKVSNFADHVTEEIAYFFEECDGPEYIDKRDRNLEEVKNSHGKWWVSESERTVLGIGQYFEGEPIFEDRNAGIVLKFNPALHLREKKYTTPRQSGNLAELQIWKYIVDNNYEKYFGTIYDFSDSGSWVAMKEYIPYYPYKSPDHTNEYVTGKMTPYNFENILPGLLERDDVDIDIHCKDGNIGLERLSNGKFRLVSIDYATHTGVPDIEWTPDF